MNKMILAVMYAIKEIAINPRNFGGAKFKSLLLFFNSNPIQGLVIFFRPNINSLITYITARIIVFIKNKQYSFLANITS